MHDHYLYPNQSVLRFRGAGRGEYAADAIWEIDAHGSEPEFARAIDYEPFVRVGVLAGRRIYDFLVGRLVVDPRWITTCVTRMGVTVCVDWRALGPRRLWELLLLVRWVESQVFADGELCLLGTAVGASPTIDASIYLTSEYARRPGALGAHWLRPVGGRHAKSSDATCEFRKTPVPHDEFTSENAAVLTLASRGISSDTATWARPEWLSPRGIVRWPEARSPGADRHVEGKAPMATALVELLDREDLIDDLPTEYRQEVTRIRERSVGAGRFKSTSEGTAAITQDVIARVAVTIDPNARERSDLYQLDCPRASCKQRDRKAALLKESGVFTCFRCLHGTGITLQKLCEELSLAHLLPKAHANSKGIQRRLVEDVTLPPEQWSGTGTSIILRRPAPI